MSASTATTTPTLSELPPLASVRQVARACNVSERHVLRLCERGELKAVRLGKVWRINRDALMRMAGVAPREDGAE